MRLEYWKAGRDWWWHLRAGNGEIIAHGESYRRKRDLLGCLDLLQCDALDAAPRIDITAQNKRPLIP